MSLLLNKVFTRYYKPEGDTPNSGGTPPAGSDKQDDITFLSGDEEPEADVLDLTPKKAKSEAKDEDDDTDDKDDKDDEGEPDDADGEEPTDDEDELEDLLAETEKPDAEKLELTTPVRRKEILKKYPNLFKDFPYLEKAYYREQQFTEIVPTIDDAREAVQAKETLDNFEKALMGGDVSTTFKAVREEDPNAFYKIVDSLLPTIASVDESAYHHLVGNMTKHTIAAMVKEAKASDNEVLMSAAQILNQFVFGKSEYTPPSNLAKADEKRDDEKENSITQREREFVQQQFTTAKDTLNTRLNNTLKATIEAHIDPKGSMGEFVKRAAIRQVTEELNQLIGKDSRFKTITDRLWQAAHKSNYSRESMERIRSAYLSKSKTLLGPVIKKARIEALKGMGKRVRETVEDKEEVTSPKKKSRDTERPPSNSSGKKGSVPSGMSTLDFLNSD